MRITLESIGEYGVMSYKELRNNYGVELYLSGKIDVRSGNELISLVLKALIKEADPLLI